MDTCKKPISLENAVERLYHVCDKADRLEKKSQEKEGNKCTSKPR
jgi:hypothetical protein